jgi:hypothetical protein
VALVTSTEGAEIYYTTDGSSPDSTKTKYSAPISITTAVTIKAIAVKAGLTDSEILTALYSISAPGAAARPSANPGAGEVAAGTTVALVTSTEGADIYYTIDGSSPDSTKTKYSAPISITTAVTIKAIAVKSGLTDSAVLEAAYTIVESPPADITPPAEVTGLSGIPGDGAVSLSWTDPADADLASLEITWSPDGTAPQTVAKGAGTYAASGLTNGTAYTFTVKAVDATGNSSAGVTSAALTPLAPAGIVKVQFAGPGDETITLTGADGALSWAANTALNVSVSETFSACRWALDGVVMPAATGGSLSLNAGELSVKQHTLTVVVTKDGVEYSKVVQFTVGN